MTPAVALDNYRARFGGMLTASKIAEPMVRALLWKRRRWDLEHIRDNDYWPDDPRHDFVCAELSDCAAEHRKLIQQLWDNRRLERGAANAIGSFLNRSRTPEFSAENEVA